MATCSLHEMKNRLGMPCPICTNITLRNELEKAKAALDAAADTLRDCHQELEASGYAYDHPSLIRYRIAVDEARALRDTKGEK